MDRKQKVLLMLKPKVKAFGFNKKELQGIAAKIADNLTFVYKQNSNKYE